MKSWILMLLCATLGLPMIASAAACCAVDEEEADATAEAPALPDESIYQLGSVWTNANGTAVDLPSLRGSYRVVAMFFASCKYVCPMLVQDLKRIQQALPADAAVVYTLFSFDSENDTPAALRDFAERQEINTPDWLLFTGAPDAVRELSAVLGIRYRKESDGSFSHSNQITLLDPDGRVLAQLQRLKEDVAPLVAALNKDHGHEHAE